MFTVTLNSVLRIEDRDLDGIYRVVAMPMGAGTVWLAFLAPRQIAVDSHSSSSNRPAVGALTMAAIATLEALAAADALTKIAIQPRGKLLTVREDLTEIELAISDRRIAIMSAFLNHEILARTLNDRKNVGALVRAAVEQHGCSRSTVHRLWGLLCEHGIEVASFNPRFDRCGAPGVLRPISLTRKKPGPRVLKERLGDTVVFPQRGVTEKDRNLILFHYRKHEKASGSAKQRYDKVILSAYVEKYLDSPNGLIPVLPPQGSFPNQRQMRHIVESGVCRLERVLRRTTEGHFQRNLRGLHGRSHDGIAGPGHMYAIDSTIGDIHLRSSVNRAWLIGRPIVYIVADVWSSAIVGFYVCLSGPSWATAKVALYSTFTEPDGLARIWGAQSAMALSPAPGIPFALESDRGEYLSTSARETGKTLGINMSFNPAYRPDLKGLVEVLNRITKDEQYYFLPGAIDARRRELELKPDARESALTLREYVQFLYSTFTHYNLFAPRESRLTSEMLGAGVVASPAGLWRFGHEMGVGYRKEVSEARLITNLLPAKIAVARRDGIFLDLLQYEAPIATEQSWTAHARNFGVIEKKVHHFPGSTGKFWWPDPSGHLHEFSLRANARAGSDISLDEWRDAYLYERKKKDDREYERVRASLEKMVSTEALRKNAVKLTKAAEERETGQRPSVREARVLETALHVPGTEVAENEASFSVAEKNVQYESLMDNMFASMNREALQ